MVGLAVFRCGFNRWRSAFASPANRTALLHAESKDHLFPNDFYEDSVWKFTVNKVDHAVLNEAFKNLSLRWRSGWPRGRFPGRARWTRWICDDGRGAAHATVHGVVGELVGFFIAAAQCVLDFEFFKLIGPAARFFPEGAKVRAVDFVFALHLLDHEFRVGDYADAGLLVFNAPGENAEQGRVFSVVVGAFAEVFAQAGEDAALLIFNDGAVAGGAGITA
jgi:hypothetical protein